MKHNIHYSQQGFTLLEMLVVVTIISLLAALVGPRLFTQVDATKVKTASTQVKMLKGALETMRLDIGRFPTEEEGLNLLRVAPRDEKIQPFWKGPYLDQEVPLDPWNHPYIYQLRGRDSNPFALYSYGGDGQIGGTGNNADIGLLPAN